MVFPKCLGLNHSVSVVFCVAFTRVFKRANAGYIEGGLFRIFESETADTLDHVHKS